MRLAVFFMALTLVVLACASERPSDDDDGSTTSGAGAASVDVCNSIGTTGAGVTTGAGGSMECAAEWNCDDGYSYGVRCSGTPGSWACECLHNGPAVSTFESATFCELNNDQARVDEANTQCNFSIQ